MDDDLTKHRGLACMIVRRSLGWREMHQDFEDAIQTVYLEWWRERAKWDATRGWSWPSWAVRVGRAAMRQFRLSRRRRGLTMVGERSKRGPAGVSFAGALPADVRAGGPPIGHEMTVADAAARVQELVVWLSDREKSVCRKIMAGDSVRQAIIERYRYDQWLEARNFLRTVFATTADIR